MQIISEVHLQKAVKTDHLEIDVTTISKFINMNAACSERGWNKIMYAEQYYKWRGKILNAPEE